MPRQPRFYNEWVLKSLQLCRVDNDKISVGGGWATNAMFMSYVTGLPVDLLIAMSGFNFKSAHPYILHRATSPDPPDELLNMVLPDADAWTTRFQQVTML
jgi:hypothetical protein